MLSMHFTLIFRYFSIGKFNQKIYLITWNIHCCSARVTIADGRLENLLGMRKTFSKWKLTEFHKINFFSSFNMWNTQLASESRQNNEEPTNTYHTTTETRREKRKSSISFSYSFVIIFRSFTKNGEFYSHIFSTFRMVIGVMCVTLNTSQSFTLVKNVKYFERTKKIQWK